MKKLTLAALLALPLVGGCYAGPGYYARPSHVRVYPRGGYGYVRPVYAPPRVRVYW